MHTLVKKVESVGSHKRVNLILLTLRESFSAALHEESSLQYGGESLRHYRGISKGSDEIEGVVEVGVSGGIEDPNTPDDGVEEGQVDISASHGKAPLKT